MVTNRNQFLYTRLHCLYSTHFCHLITRSSSPVVLGSSPSRDQIWKSLKADPDKRSAIERTQTPPTWTFWSFIYSNYPYISLFLSSEFCSLLTSISTCFLLCTCCFFHKLGVGIDTQSDVPVLNDLDHLISVLILKMSFSL